MNLLHYFYLQSISPGVVKTEIFDVAHIDTSVLKEMPALNPEDIASSIVHVIAAPHHVQITELTVIPLGQVQWKIINIQFLQLIITHLYLSSPR